MSVFFGIAYLRCGATSSCAVKVTKLLQKNNKRFCPPFYSTALIRLADTSLSCGAIGQHVGARVASEVSVYLRWCRSPQGESNPPAVNLNTYFHGRQVEQEHREHHHYKCKLSAVKAQ